MRDFSFRSVHTFCSESLTSGSSLRPSETRVSKSAPVLLADLPPLAGLAPSLRARASAPMPASSTSWDDSLMRDIQSGVAAVEAGLFLVLAMVCLLMVGLGIGFDGRSSA